MACAAEPSTRRDASSQKCVLYGVRTLDSQPLSVSGTREVSPPAPGADMHDWKEYLNYQLDSLRGFAFLGGLVMLFGPRTRLHGGASLRWKLQLPLSPLDEAYTYLSVSLTLLKAECCVF